MPFSVLELLPTEPCRAETAYRIRREEGSSAAYAEAVRVIETIGGAVDRFGVCTFNYEPEEVLRQIAVTGCIPDRIAHQFYPTPKVIAEAAAEMAEIGEADTVLEPSAGQGDLAVHLPKERTTCIEISALHCAVLAARGFDATQADFLSWSKSAPMFSRVVMNPPYSEGRWRLHLEAAVALVKTGGRLVAVLPASARNKVDLLPGGWTCTWSGTYDREFAGTSVSVAIVAASFVPSP